MMNIDGSYIFHFKVSEVPCIVFMTTWHKQEMWKLQLFHYHLDVAMQKLKVKQSLVIEAMQLFHN